MFGVRALPHTLRRYNDHAGQGAHRGSSVIGARSHPYSPPLAVNMTLQERYWVETGFRSGTLLTLTATSTLAAG